MHQTAQLNAENPITRRMFRVMAATVAVGTIATLAVAPWRVTTGILLGGILSLLNFHFLQTSIAAAFGAAQDGIRPSLRPLRFLWRYLILGLCVYAAYQLNVVSVPAALVGMCSFVLAMFVEAIRETYFILVHREGIN